MRILWHGISPVCNTGYGNITAQLLPCIRERGHFIRIATRHVDHSWYSWNGIDIVEGINIAHVNSMIEEDGFDIVFTCWDIWQLEGRASFPREKWVAYIPVDAQLIPARLATIATQTDTQIAMSLHGKGELEKIGLKPLYGPHGIPPEFKPKGDRRKIVREAWGLTDENFLIGSVGINYSDDRKGFFPLMQAFQIFHERHPEARLYFHTHWPGIINNTVNYAQIAEALGIAEYVIVPNQAHYDIGRFSKAQMADIYNIMDVFCLATRGEGFGLPAVEAQACGTPAILTNNTTGPQLCASGWLIKVDPLDDMFWMLNQGWRLEPRPSAILEQLEIAHAEWKSGADTWGKRKAQALDLGREYDWDRVWRRYWISIFEYLEDKFNA